MLTILYAPLAIVDLLATLISILLLNWWAPAFARNDAHLPMWLSWLDTFDADLDAGNRDLNWNRGYWGRVAWLCRNPMYTFSYRVLGIPFDPQQWRVVRFTSPSQGPLTFYAVGPRGAFNWYGIRFGLRIKFGWKAWNLVDSDVALSTGRIVWKTKPWGPAWRVPIVFSVSRT